MGRMNLEGIDFPHQRRADLEKADRKANLVKPKSVSQKPNIENKRESAEQREIRRLETKNEIYKKAIKILAVPLAIVELVNIGKLASAQGKSEVRKVRPTHSVTQHLNDSELRALKGNPVRKEETRSPEASEEKLSQKTYEVFINSQKLMGRLEQNRSVYDQAAKVTGVDWKVLAAIHYRESELSSSHSTVSGEELGTRNPDTGKTYNSLLESAIESGKIFKENLKSFYGIDYNSDSETLKKGLITYNRGGMYPKNNKSPEESPYVMNFYNEKYNDMVWPNSEAEPANLRGEVNEMYGAFTVCKMLEQAEEEGRI